MSEKLLRALRSTLCWLLPAILAGALILRSNTLAHRGLLWADELLSWYPVSGSFATVFTAAADTINSAPPLYFVVAWPWAHLFGGSPISLRLFSAIAAAATLLIMFAVLRRVYGTLPSILALVLIAVDAQFLLQSQQARFHPLFSAEVAFAIFILQRVLAKRSAPFSLLVLNTLAHVCMMLTSYISLFYSPALLGAVIIVSIVRRRNPTRICLSIVASWLVLLPWIPVILRHNEMGKLGWIPVPTPKILRTYFEGYVTGQFRWFVLILIAAVGLSTILSYCFGGRGRREGFRRGERALLATGVALMAVPFLLYAISSRPGVNPLFHERYMVASVLGWAILLAHLAHRAFLLRHRLAPRPLVAALVAIQLLMTLAFVGSNIRRLVREARNYRAQSFTSDLAAQLPGDEPIVIEYIHEFLSWHYYSPRKSRYRFLLDPEVGRKEVAGGPTNHAIMGALRRQFPERFQEVMPTDDFLRGASSFYLHHSPGYQWYPVRLLSNPNFKADEMPDNLFHVRRVVP